ncbi:MAG: hypothetical protein WBJ84_06790 [Bacteroidales bacterium]
MKKYIVLLGLVLFIGGTAMAQWTKTGTTIHPTTLSDKLGIGTNNAEFPLYILDQAVGTIAAQEKVVNHTGGAALLMRKARGTVAAKSTPLNNDIIGGLFGQAWDGSAYRNVATMRFLADGNLSAGNSSGKIVFQTTPTGSTALVDRMVINNAGKVGIGVTDFTKLGDALLGVNGKILATEVEVKLFGNWPDFVFLKDYNLMPLNEVEQFINENGHLPNVPSEVQVKENGINLGQMNAVLLQKIEELTLHIIDLNKRISELEK